MSNQAIRRFCPCLVGIALAPALYQGCRGHDSAAVVLDGSPSPSCDLNQWCPKADPWLLGPIYGVRDDGRINISAVEAWPNRPPKTPRLEPAEVAEACAALAACMDLSCSPFDGLWARAELQSLCPLGSLSLFDINAPERVIPIGSFPQDNRARAANESWEFALRTVLAARGNCTQIQQVLTERAPFIECQEDGCYATEFWPLTCNGDIATFRTTTTTLTRDCSRSGTHCSEASRTGCTDRQLIHCSCAAQDRCDGDIKLGCDHCGFVTYHDCSWNGGHCEETTEGTGAHCVPPVDPSTCVGSAGCNGSSLTLCTPTGAVDVDCSTIAGMQCVPLERDAPFTGAICSPCGPGGCAMSSDAGCNDGGAGLDGGTQSATDASLHD